jgi:TonB-linked SusC/RagA family outer membrane protein
MKNQLTFKNVWTFCFLLLGLTLQAQFTASGKVTDESGNPLIGVTIVIKGGTTGTLSDADGNYSLSIPDNSATLVFSYLGYAEVEREANSSQGNLNLSLTEKATIMDEVVVSGLATSIKRSNSANAVATIEGKDLTGTTVQQTMDGALYGKFTGANIVSNSGAPGGGIAIKLRGVTTLTGNSQPLFIIDGVYLDNSSISSGLNSLSLAYRDGRVAGDQDNPSNRIADLDPEDIDKIEILKGASAAAIYGSRAGAGVVIISTKRGRAGKPRVDVSQSIGTNSAINLLGVRQWNAAKAKEQYGVNGEAAFNAAQAAGKIYDYEEELYGNTGVLSSTRLNISGGDNRTKYFAGMTYKNEDGIVPQTGFERLNFRLNLDHKISKWFDVSLSSNYMRSSSDRGYFNNDNNSSTIGISLASTPSWAELHPDELGNYPNNPHTTSNFLQTANLMTNNEKVDRFIVGGTLTTHLLQSTKSSLNLVIRGGIDYYTLLTDVLAPSTLQFQKDGNGTNGASIIGTTLNTNKNIGVFLVHNWQPSSFGFRTQIGMTAENFDQNSILNKSTFLIGSQSNLNQAGSISVLQSKIIQKDRGFFMQEEVNWDDKIFFTLGMRADKSSNNGDANKLYYYPKASLAVNVTKLGDFGNDQLNDLKLRVAYGQSGNFAKFGSIYTPLNSIVIDGSTGSIIGKTFGNDELGPEKQTEIELGFDLGLLNNKVLVDFTYYQKNIEDLVLQIRIPGSTGFTDKWLNAATLNNNGIEIGASIDVINNRNFNWNTRLGFWKNTAKIEELNVPPYIEGGFAPILGVFLIEKGQSPTQIIGVTPDTTDTDGLAVLGDAEPDFNLSWSNTLTFGNFDLSFLLHWKKGGDNVNLTTLLSDFSGTSGDYDETNLDPKHQLPNGVYRLSQLGSNAQPFVEDASYIRLREIGLYYRIPKRLFNNKAQLRVGVSGRNLINIFDYNSYDPEVSNFGIRAISNAIDVTPFPSSKTLVFTVSASF